MKKYFCLALVLFTSVVTFAQEKNIEQAEFDKIYKSSFQWFPDQPRREIRTEESVFEAITPVNTTSLPTITPQPHKSLMKIVAEFLPGKYHSIFESSSESFSSKRETIRISEKTYQRKDNGKWTEITSESRPKIESRTKTTRFQNRI